MSVIAFTVGRVENDQMYGQLLAGLFSGVVPNSTVDFLGAERICSETNETIA